MDDMEINAHEESTIRSELCRMWPGLELKLDSIYDEDQRVNTQFLSQCHDEVYNYAMYVTKENIKRRINGQQEFTPGKSHKVLENLYLKAISWIDSKANTIVENFRVVPCNVQILNLYSNEWRRFKAVHRKIQFVFNYVDRYYVPSQRNNANGRMPEIFKVALTNWYNKIFMQRKDVLADEIMHCIDLDRNEKRIDRALVACASKSFIEIGACFESDPRQLFRPLETKLLKSTQLYYENMSRRLLNEMKLCNTLSFADYLNKTSKILQNEKQRVNTFMDLGSLAATVSICEKCLIKDHDVIFNKFFRQFLSNDERQMISQLFDLISRFPECYGIFKATFEDQIVKEANDAIGNLKASLNGNPKEYVDILSKTINKYESIVANELKGNAEFRAAFFNAAEKFVNNNVVVNDNIDHSKKNAGLLASYCDNQLNTESMFKSREQDFEELEKSLACVFRIVQFTNDKFGFIKFYENISLPRIIFSKSKSDDLESFMIEQIDKVKKDIKVEDVNDLKGMLNDSKTSKVINDEFKKTLLEPNFSVLVIKKRPYVKLSPYAISRQYLKIFPVFESTMKRFNKFYIENYSGERKVNRKLVWLHNLGRGELIAQLSGKQYNLLTGAFQAAVLMAFNERDSYTFQELTKVLGNSGCEEEALTFLSNTMTKLFESTILICSGDHRKIGPNTMISLNTNFQSTKELIELETSMNVESANACNNVEADYENVTNAAMVRIFKRKKRMRPSDLLDHLTYELKKRFKPEKEIMEQSIRFCLRNDYITIDKNDNSQYIYSE